MKKHLLLLLLALCLLSACALGETVWPEMAATVAEVRSDGSVVLDLSMQTAADCGYEPGDVLSVIAGGTVCNVPLVESFADVNMGSMYAAPAGDRLMLALHGDNFSSVTGCSVGSQVSLWMFAKGGYMTEYLARRAVYSQMRAPDYADPVCWAMLGVDEDRPADVFLVCPTVDMGENGSINMSLDNQQVMADFYGALMMERGIYEDSCRVFAPYYRQMTMPVYLSGYTQDSDCFVRAYSDVAAAFDYYMEHYNDGRPVVLAGFSQGAEMILRLMKDRFDDDALRAQLVAAYAIGWRVTQQDVAEAPWLQMAQGADDTGVIVSFNTETPWAQRSLIVPEGMRTLSINPLSWSTDSLHAGREMNLGACFTDYSGAITKEIPQMTGAYLDPVRGTLRVTDVNEAEYAPGFLFLGEGSYHLYDYQFFFRNLQENVARRVENYVPVLNVQPAA